MDKMQDKAVKFLNDVRRKKVAVGSEGNCRLEPINNVLNHNGDLLSNNCFYCQKIFINSKFLLKHIMRRHSENLIHLHRKCLKPEYNNNSIDSHNLLKFLQDEFSTLREELIVVNQPNKVLQSDHNSTKEKRDVPEKYELKQHDSSTSRGHRCDNSHGMDDFEINELEILKEKILVLESNIEHLCNKYEEVDTALKDKILSKQDVHNIITANENKFIEAQEVQFIKLRSILHDKVHDMVFNQLQQNNIELQSQLFELKEEISRLDHLIVSVRKQINSPDHLRDLEKKLDDKIIKFLGRGGRSNSMISKTRYSITRNKSKVPSCTQPLTKNVETSVKQVESGGETFPPRNSTSHIPELNSFELSYMLAEKMSSLGIDPSTSKMSAEEYKAKMKLIEFEKKQLMKKNRIFLKTYDKIDLLADDKVNYALQKKDRKLRFSEPLICKHERKSNKKKLHNKTHPVLENGDFTFSEPSKSLYLKSNHGDFENPTYSSSDINGHKFRVSGIGKREKCFGNFLEIHRSKRELQSTPLKEDASTKIVHKVDSPVVDINNLETGFFSNSVQFDSEGKNCSNAQDSESSSTTAEDRKVFGKDTVNEPSKISLDNKVMSDDEVNSLASLSDWKDDDNS